MKYFKDINLKVIEKKMLSDTATPVSIYLRVRDAFANSLLFESSDYHSQENNLSYICINPIASFSTTENNISYRFPHQKDEKLITVSTSEVLPIWKRFKEHFHVANKSTYEIGFFGHCFYNAVTYFDTLKLNNKKPRFQIDDSTQIPTIRYDMFQYVITIDHYKNTLIVTELLWDESQESSLEYVFSIINSKNIPNYSFFADNIEKPNMSDDAFINIVEKAKEHCRKGNIFQIVPSRAFSKSFTGDEFNVYRALRSINPSPYLFYLDYGSYKLMGSSPEAHLIVNNGKAEIHPIAGTFKRTGDDEADAVAAKKLFNDVKENSEHIMLVDLARNDLSKHCDDVKLTVYKEIQFYSHVIHLVSKVSGFLKQDVSPLQLIADTFPAGTLSGAPKYKAMEIIDEMEPNQRTFYGGAVGFMGLNDSFNHAIIIRSILSINNSLQYQAGAGVVDMSNPQSELNEVSNKLGALRSAIEKAEQWI